MLLVHRKTMAGDNRPYSGHDSKGSDNSQPSNKVPRLSGSGGKADTRSSVNLDDASIGMITITSKHNITWRSSGE